MSLNSDIAERGVEVLARIGRSKMPLADANFIAHWVCDARNALRAPLAALPTGDLVDRLLNLADGLEATNGSARPTNVSKPIREADAHIQALTAERDGLGEQIERMEYSDGDAEHWRHLATTAEARVKVLEKALEPFAEAADNTDGNDDYSAASIWEHPCSVDLTIGHLRRRPHHPQPKGPIMSRITGRTSILAIIERRRDELGISEAEICRRAGVGVNAISNIRAYPKRGFRLDTVVALVEALGLTLVAGEAP